MQRIILLASVAVVCSSYAGTAAAGPAGHFAGPSAGVDIGWAHVMGQIDDVNHNYANTAGFQDVQSSDGFLLGGHLGYDWQFGGQWVAGLEAGVQSITADTANCGAAGCANGSGDTANLGYDMKGIATFKGRVGFIVMPETLLYVSGGFALAEVATQHHDNEQYDGTTRSFSGYTVGAGVQHELTQNADVRLDFAWDQFSSKHWEDNADEPFGARPEAITLSFGAVWHLD